MIVTPSWGLGDQIAIVDLQGLGGHPRAVPVALRPRGGCAAGIVAEACRLRILPADGTPAEAGRVA